MKTRALALVLFLLPAVALAQGYLPGSNFTLLPGQKLCLNGVSCTDNLKDVSGVATFSGNVTTTGFFAASAGFGNGTLGGASQGMAFSGGTTQIVAGGAGQTVQIQDNGGTVYAKFGNTQITTLAGNNPVPVVHGAQASSAQAMEFGSGTATAGGALAVTFAAAFAIAPNCVCSDQNAAPAACGISTASSTSGVTFTIGSARADTVQWFCIGAK